MAPRQKTWAKIRAKARDQGRQFLQDISTTMPQSGYLAIARKNQDLDDAAYQIELEKQEEEKAEQKIVKDQERKEKAKARYQAKKLEEENDPELAAEAKAKRKAYAAKRKAAKEAAKAVEMAKQVGEDGKDAEMPDAEVSDADSEPVSKKQKQKQTLGKRPLQASIEDEDDESESEQISKKNKRAPAKKSAPAANVGLANPIPSKKNAPPAKVDITTPTLGKKNASAAKADLTNPLPSKKNAPAANVNLNNPLLANCGGERQWPLYPGRASRKASNTIGIAQIALASKSEFFKALTKTMGPFADRGAEILMDGEGGVVVRFPKADTAEMVKDEIDGKEVAGKKVQITYVA